MKMNKKIMIAAAIACFASVQSASAIDFKHAYTQCGLGGIIGNAAGDDSGIVAIITNVTFDLGTTAVISAATDGCSGKSGKMASLVNDAYVPLEQDIAQGQGEYLDAMLATAGCDTADKATVANVRQDFAAEVVAPGYASKTQFEKSEAMFNVFQANTAQCSS
ncbi:MAG: DUF3015 family protein [Ghiorsea sp.]|nr:DUF3015 family protein [Ghiorsea sp.]